MDILEYVPNELDMALPSVIVEGKNDFFALKYFIEIQNDLAGVHLVPGMSCSNVSTLISLFYSWGKEYIILLDSDIEAQNNKKTYQEKFGSIVDGRIFTLKDICGKWSKHNMESILSNSQKLRIQQSLFGSKKYSKNVYNKAIQELLMTRKKIGVDASILEDFRRIHTFLISKLNG